jgi:hypothetical protein
MTDVLGYYLWSIARPDDIWLSSPSWMEVGFLGGSDIRWMLLDSTCFSTR